MADTAEEQAMQILRDATNAHLGTFKKREAFDSMIGRLDRILSEFLIEARSNDLDEADRQTINHHADDLIGVGNTVLNLAREAKARKESNG